MTGFDPAAEFLLSMAWQNLFEPTGRDDIFRCKGCNDDEIRRSDREAHFNRHRGIQRRSETMRQRRIRRERIEQLALARSAT